MNLFSALILCISFVSLSMTFVSLDTQELLDKDIKKCDIRKSSTPYNTGLRKTKGSIQWPLHKYIDAHNYLRNSRYHAINTIHIKNTIQARNSIRFQSQNGKNINVSHDIKSLSKLETTSRSPGWQSNYSRPHYLENLLPHYYSMTIDID